MRFTLYFLGVKESHFLYSMTAAFDEDIQEMDCTVLFKFNGEFDICVTAVIVVYKLSCHGEGIVNVSKPNGRASVVVKNPFLFKMAHKEITKRWTFSRKSL